MSSHYSSSSTSSKRPPGPERPTIPDEPPPVFEGSAGEGKWGKLSVLILVIVLILMFLLAFAFCLAGGIKYHQPRYFLLLVNIILSTSVTGALVFCYYRGVLAPALLWFIFVQCTFLFFQCITTDIFAWYETKGSTPDIPIVNPSVVPIHTVGPNCTHLHCNGSNGSNETNLWYFRS